MTKQSAKVHTMKLKNFALYVSLVLTNGLLAQAQEQTCSVNGEERDPALKEMKYNIGEGEKTFMAYVEPDVTTFYKGIPPASKRVVPKFNGLAGKFINMSNKYVRLYWESFKGGRSSLIRHYKPLSAGGTATFPGHRFFWTPEDDPNTRLMDVVVGEYPNSIYAYDPYNVEGDPAKTEENLKDLSENEREFYEKWRKTILFNEQYVNFTGRTYLANYLRDPPSHYMWRADYFGQEHWITTKETHCEAIPPEEELEPIMTHGKSRILKDDDPRLLQEYRVKDQQYMNMTLKVLSCAPRVFEIRNFLSQTEVSHILQLAGAVELHESTTGDVGVDDKVVSKEEEKVRKTRTSLNSWVPRERSPIVDAIYRRSADLMRIDEALLRHRGDGEYPAMPTNKTISESLQLVHYDLTQEVSIIFRVNFIWVLCFLSSGISA